MIIAIDGPSGSGKSSVAKEISKRLNIFYLNTGSMYRALGYKIFKEKLEVKDALSLLDNFDLKLINGKFYLDDEDIEDKIVKNEISILASEVSKIKEVREYMVNLQRKLSANNSVILDGRDVGTVIFPNADIKIYLTASVEVRAKRRYLQDGTLSYEEILDYIIKRDYEDSNRVNSPLRKAEDAIEIVSDNLNFEEVVDKIIDIVKEKYESKSNN